MKTEKEIDEYIKKNLEELPKTDYGVGISDDQVDYETGFDVINFKWHREENLPVGYYIHSEKLYFNNESEAKKRVDELNELVESNSYHKTSEKIDILLELLED